MTKEKNILFFPSNVSIHLFSHFLLLLLGSDGSSFSCCCSSCCYFFVIYVILSSDLYISNFKREKE